MKRALHVCLLLTIFFATTTSLAAVGTRRAAATCTGSTPCRACKNCRYCKHCAKEGGTCGVCRRGHEAAKRQGSWEEAQQRLASESHSHH
jgi:hypothetical protein